MTDITHLYVYDMSLPSRRNSLCGHVYQSREPHLWVDELEDYRTDYDCCETCVERAPLGLLAMTDLE